jgi:hypothetical protein
VRCVAPPRPGGALARSRINPARRLLPDTVRRRLEVSIALAWESVIETHVGSAAQFIRLLGERMSLEDALARYMRELDLSGNIWQAVSTRVLVAVEADRTAAQRAAIPLREEVGNDHDGWRRFRPDVLLKGVLEKQRRSDEVERWVELLIARAEESLILTHVDNAISFAALLDVHMPYSRALGHYLDAVGLSGGRAQAVFQRTMARLADANLPAPAPPRPRPAEAEVSI